jgi:hypothetical protein
MMRNLVLLPLLALLPACADPGALTAPPPPQVVGTTATGAPIYRVRVTTSNALGVTPVSESSLRARAEGICPGGYRELSRSGAAERRISGVVYVDVELEITCL